MRLKVVYDDQGHILAAGEDEPVAREGENSGEFELPEEDLGGAELHDVLPQLRVDTGTGRLTRSGQEA